MALFHSQTRRHMISIIYLTTHFLVCLQSILFMQRSLKFGPYIGYHFYSLKTKSQQCQNIFLLPIVVALTHLSRMEFPALINWNSPFSFWGLLGGIFLVWSNFNRILCKQTVETLFWRRVLWRLIWVCTVCLSLTRRTLGLYGLTRASWFIFFFLWFIQDNFYLEFIVQTPILKWPN